MNQPIGFPVPNWKPATTPNHEPMIGRVAKLVTVEPKKHAGDLFAAYALDEESRGWTYLPANRPETVAETEAWLEQLAQSVDPFFFCIVDLQTGKAVGVASYLRMKPEVGVIEVGFITFSPAMQRTAISTETMYLMMARVFDDWGYRRYEWKCDALNAPSRAAAQRLGMTFEGIFRQATMYKGRNRDTAWFSILDSEWPEQKAAFQKWLDPSNFDEEGVQRRSLGSFRVSSHRS